MRISTNDPIVNSSARFQQSFWGCAVSTYGLSLDLVLLPFTRLFFFFSFSSYQARACRRKLVWKERKKKCGNNKGPSNEILFCRNIFYILGSVYFKEHKLYAFGTDTQCKSINDFLLPQFFKCILLADF